MAFFCYNRTVWLRKYIEVKVLNKQELKNLLVGYSLFRDLNEYELEKVAEIAISRDWNKNSHIFMQGEPLENVYFINDGKIKIYKSDINGREQIVNILKKGEMFPHVGFFRKGGYPAFAEALEPSNLAVIPISQFEKVLVQNPELSIKVFKVLGEKIVDFQERLEAQVLNNTYEQIIKLLLRLANHDGIKQPNGTILLKIDLTNRDLANMIGTTRETISRTLTKLKKDNIIQTDHEGNLLFDPDHLLDELI